MQPARYFRPRINHIELLNSFLPKQLQDIPSIGTHLAPKKEDINRYRSRQRHTVVSNSTVETYEYISNER